MTFQQLHIIEPILKALKAQGYTAPTPIQEQSIPILLRGKDLLGCAQTGTGKTAAFTIPILQNIFLNKDENSYKRHIKALIVTPTRELAIQIDESIRTYGKHTGIKHTVVFGGVKQGKQTNALQRGVDVLVATPGRLLDLINQRYIDLSRLEYFVLDEADQMLDMGFIHDIKKLIAIIPKNRQSLFFSATMPRAIVDLSRKILGDFETVTIQPEQTTAEKVDQYVYFVVKQSKIKLLAHILKGDEYDSALVFSRTKHGADKIVRKLSSMNIHAAAIHGNKSQNNRQRALNDFKDGKVNVLVATDIAARGIDVDQLSLVVNYDLPNVAETYVHRIGRTGRADASGAAISFCDGEERAYLKDIQKLIRQDIDVVEDHPYVDDVAKPRPPQERRPQRNRPNTSRNFGRNNRSGSNDRRGKSNSSNR